MSTASRINNPVFLVGSERSGTTMLRLMLDYHPDIAFHFGLEFAVKLLSDGTNDDWPDLRIYHDWLSRHRVFRLAGHTIDHQLDYPALANSFLLQKQEWSGWKPVVGATVLTHFDNLPRVWPDARYIHIVRDGRDVSRSVVGMGWAGNVYDASFHWLKAEQTWDRLTTGLRQNQWIEVRYEVLVANPVQTLHRICEFIGVSYSPEMFQYVRESAYGLPDPQLALQWKQRLSRWEVRFVEAVIGDQLRKRGYTLSNDNVIRVPVALRLMLRMDSRFRRILFGYRRFGLRLLVENVLARRLGLSEREKLVTEQAHAIINEHRKSEPGIRRRPSVNLPKKST